MAIVLLLLMRVLLLTKVVSLIPSIKKFKKDLLMTYGLQSKWMKVK